MMHTRTRIATALVALLLALPAITPAQGSVEVALRAAMETETVKGDLKGAIEEYKQIVARAGKTNRPVAAQALVRMAECYQKLGDAEARTIYERIVREFPDQKEEVALARAGLGSTAAFASAKGDRAVWTGAIVSGDGGSGAGRVSPDGRFITWSDSNVGRLLVHDVAANVDRELTPPVPGYAQAAHLSAISRDGKQVIYQYFDLPLGRVWFRSVPLLGTGLPKPRDVFLASDDVLPGWNSVASFDLSPDGKWIAAGIRRKDRTGQIMLIAVADGSFRVLKSLDWNLPWTVFFSPDSKYIAYDLPAGDGIAPRDVFVLAIDGSREIPAVVHSADEAIMGWSRDGTRLLFSSDRTGSKGLWALPFADGKVQGSPELLKPDIGSSVSLGLTASGTLYIHKRSSTRDATIAPIDLEAGKLLGPPVRFTQGFVDGAEFGPNWSPDGKHLAYSVNGDSGAGIRSVATGQVRVLPRTLNYYRNLSWSPDGRSLLTNGRDLRGRNGIFQIDAQTGEATTAVILADSDGPLTGLAQWSPDGKKVFFNRGFVRVERDLASGSEREVRGGVRSPDGQYLALRRQDPATKTASLLVAPFAGGEPREVLRLTQPEVFFGPGGNVWTPDSRAVLIVKDTGSRKELWLVPVAGGRPRKLDINPDIWIEGSPRTLDRGFTLSPDGRHIAFFMGTKANEVWALENFLPAPIAKR